MKILKYLIFISILSRIFFIIYRQSDDKGFCRWRKSFVTACIIAASVAGLIPINIEAMEPAGNNNQVYQERLISDQEFNSFETNDQQVILIRNNSSSSTVRPGLANGFPQHLPVNRPAGAGNLKPVRANKVKGLKTPRGIITGQPVTGARRQPTRLDGSGSPAGAGSGSSSDQQCPVTKKEQSQESNTPNYDSTLKSKKKKKQSKLDKLAKPDLPLEAKQKLLENPHLLELAIDPRNGQIDKQSFDEAESIIQTQQETGLFNDARRPNSEKGERDIDFIVSGSLYDEADIKTPKSFFDTRKGPKKPIPQDMLDYLAKESGAKSILQKQGSESCLHILDLKDIQSHQKESYKANFLQGAREADPELAKHIIVQND